MTKQGTNETSTQGSQLPELSLEELSAVRGGRCRGPNRGCGMGNRPR